MSNDCEDWPPDELIVTPELARRTNTGESVWSKRRLLGGDNTPPYVKIGRSVRYRWGSVVDWLAANERRSTSEGASDAA